MNDPMTLLAAGIPLSLLLDLLDERGPDSARIYAEEPSDAGWLDTRAPARAA